jgi:hypothetical protein
MVHITVEENERNITNYFTADYSGL